MLDIDLENLKQLALNATQGDWWIDSHGHAMICHDRNDITKTIFIADDRMGPATRNLITGNLSHWPNDCDASYIAAAQPRNIIELIDRLQAAESKSIKTLIDEYENSESFDEDHPVFQMAQDVDRLNHKVSELQSKLDELEKQENIPNYMFGGYEGKCSSCENNFIGEKRQPMCIKCTYEKIKKLQLIIDQTNKQEPVAVLYRNGGVMTKADCGSVFDICCEVETPLYAKPVPADQSVLSEIIRAVEFGFITNELKFIAEGKPIPNLPPFKYEVKL